MPQTGLADLNYSKTPFEWLTACVDTAVVYYDGRIDYLFSFNSCYSYKYTWRKVIFIKINYYAFFSWFNQHLF